MLYFEVRERLKVLTEFRDLYREYISFTNRSENVPAQMIRKKMWPHVDAVVDSLNRVGLGRISTKDAPVRGGRTIRINLIKAIFRDHVIGRFQLNEKEPLHILEKGILAYRSRYWRERLQLYNPFFWLYHFIGFVARLPIYFFQKAGFDTEQVEQSAPLRLFAVLVQFAAFYVVLKWSGLVNWIWFDIIAL